LDKIWLQVFAVMIGGSVLKYLFANPLLWVIVDLAVLGIAFVLLKRYPFIDLKKSMSFLGSLTAVSILVDLGVVDGMIGNIAVLALVAWMIYKGGSGGGRRPRRR